MTNLLIIITVFVMDLLTGMELDIFVPSFPELQSQFHLSPAWVEALLSANFVGYCLGLIFLGDLSDRYGNKPIILLGLLIFILGTMLCLLPYGYDTLLVGRFLQGLGIAAPAILSFVIIADNYQLKEQQVLMAMMNGSYNIAAGIAPVIGSYITLYFHWQGNFVFLFAFGLIIFLMTLLFIPAANHAKHHETLALRGLNGYITIFQSKPLVLLMLNLLLVFVPYWIFIGMTPLLYMKDLGVSLAHFGYYQGVLSIVFALGSILFGFILNRHTGHQLSLLRWGMRVLVLSLMMLSVITLLDVNNALMITLGFLPFIIGQIIPSNILYPLCLNLIPDTKGRVSAIIQGARLILTAMALQIAGYFYVGSFRSIGIILSIVILAAIISLFYVMKNKELMIYSEKK